MLEINFTKYDNYITDCLTQWDLNQQLRITGLSVSTAPTVLFSNKIRVTAEPVNATIINNAIVVDVPNGLLTESYPVYAYIRVSENSGSKTLAKVKIPVTPATKPENYEYEENITLLTYEAIRSKIESRLLISDFNKNKTEVDQSFLVLQNEINELKANGTTSDVIEAAVTKWIDTAIEDGTLANLTIADDSITWEKLKGTAYKYRGLSEINYEICKSGYTIDTSTGAEKEASDYSISPKISVIGYSYIIAHGNNQAKANFYDASNNFLSYSVFTYIDPNPIAVPTDAAYVIVSAPTSTISGHGITLVKTNTSSKPGWAYSNWSKDNPLLTVYKSETLGNGSLSPDFTAAFSNNSVPLQSLKGTNARRYNFFNNGVFTEIKGTTYQLLEENPHIYYFYYMNSGKTDAITVKRYYVDGWVEICYCSGFGYVYNGYKPVPLDFTQADETHGDILFTSIQLRFASNGSTIVNNDAIMFSDNPDLTEYYPYDKLYYNPSNELEDFFNSLGDGNDTKVYDGGVMLTIGDSYTAYMNSHFSTFAEKHGLVQDNRGIASSTIAGDTGGNIGFRPFWDRIDTAVSEYNAGHDIDGTVYSAEDVKLITFMGGANDWSTVNDTVNRLGTGPNNTDKGTLYGALNYCFATLLKSFPNADIVCILQPCNYSSTVPTTEENAKSVGFESLAQVQEMTDAQYSVYVMQRKERIVRTMAEQYGLPIADCCFSWYNPCNPNDAAKYWQSDKLHCTREGHDAIIKVLEKTVNNLPFNRN